MIDIMNLNDKIHDEYNKVTLVRTKSDSNVENLLSVQRKYLESDSKVEQQCHLVDNFSSDHSDDVIRRTGRSQSESRSIKSRLNLSDVKDYKLIRKNCQSQSQVEPRIVIEAHKDKLCQAQSNTEGDLNISICKVDISKNCQTQPKVETNKVNKAQEDKDCQTISNINSNIKLKINNDKNCQAKSKNKFSIQENMSEPSELELMFKKIKDRKQINLDRSSPKDKINKANKMSQNTTMSQKKLKSEESLSIKKDIKTESEQ